MSRLNGESEPQRLKPQFRGAYGPANAGPFQSSGFDWIFYTHLIARGFSDGGYERSPNGKRQVLSDAAEHKVPRLRSASASLRWG